MNRHYVTWLAAGVLAFAISCGSPAPKDTRAADEKAIRDGEVAWSTDFGSKDVDKIVSHYADNATVMLPGMPLINGKDAIRDGFNQVMRDKNFSLTFTTSAAEVSKGGDLAYTQGTYTMMETDPKTKKPVMEKGKYVTVYKKQADGSWKAIEDINNADAPAVTSAAAEPQHAARPARAKKAARRRR